MKLTYILTAVLFTAGMGMVALTDVSASEAAQQPGETLFNKHCAACHPAGGNVISPQKTLHKKDMKANKIKTADDIVNIMRNPGPGMTKFDAKAVPEQDARIIADYIMKTFK